MNDQRTQSEICALFEALDLHDSRLFGVHLVRRDADNQDVHLDVELLRGSYPNYSWETVSISFLDCQIIKLDMDLGALLVCGDAIDSSSCQKASPLKEFIEKEQLKYERSPLAEYLHFSIAMCPPSGKLDILARSFELGRRPERRPSDM